MRDVGSSADLVSCSRGQLAGDRLHLWRLRTSLERTTLVIRQAATAYSQSRQLLDRIDGAPYAPLLGEIHIPE
jgi:hypothetical protein